MTDKEDPNHITNVIKSLVNESKGLDNQSFSIQESLKIYYDYLKAKEKHKADIEKAKFKRNILDGAFIFFIIALILSTHIGYVIHK